jgi:hexosaminidase
VVIKEGKLPLYYGLHIIDHHGKPVHIVDSYGKPMRDSLYISPSTFDKYFTVLALFDENIHSIPYILEVLDVQNPTLGSEGYHLRITKDSIQIQANTIIGILYATNTVDQILNGLRRIDSVQCIDIVDYPTYSYRAMHLDVCRHFFSKDFIKKYIDQLAYYKINTLHWHLTDDQGWRIEIKKYAKLTEVGAWRTEKDGSRYGGYYTQDDIKEIVQYAKERFITIIPEIEMPGHSSAALAAYPYLGCTGQQISVPNTWGIKKDIYAPTDTVFRFFEDVMDEVCALFPGRYIHIGGDEAPKTQWKSSPIAQAVMKQNNLKKEEELQHYFMHKVEKYLNSKGKIAIGWGEVVKGGLSDSMVVMSWLSKGAGIKAAKHGNDVIMAPRGYCYFDYPQEGDMAKAFWMLPLPLKKVYSFSPVPGGLLPKQQKHILGGEATLWTEYVTSEAQVQHQLMPRLAALAEALWTSPSRKNYKDFVQRLKAIYTK